MSPPADATVIICSRNRPEFLSQAVESVLGGSAVPGEIVIVDQSDEPHAVLAQMGARDGCQVRYVPAPARGVSAARNRGWRLARHAVVAFTDDDVFVAPGWLAELTAALAELGPRGVVTGRVLATEGEVEGGFAPALVTREEPTTYEGRVARDVLEAGNMALHKALLAEVGGFDEALGPGTAFPAGEDNDLGYRLLAAGCRIRYAPGATIYHRAWRCAQEYVPLRWRYGVGQGAYYAKHIRLSDRYMLGRLGRLLRHHLGLALRRRRNPRVASGHLAYVAGVISGAVKWLASRGGRTRAGPRAE